MARHGETSAKGKIAESIVFEMFSAMGYKVFRSGMEYILPEFGKIGELNKQGEVATLIRRMPDFILYRQGLDPFFVEVKYSRDGTVTLIEGYPFPHAFWLVVSPTSILIQRYDKLKNGDKLTTLTKCNDFPTLTPSEISIVMNAIKLTKDAFKWDD